MRRILEFIIKRIAEYRRARWEDEPTYCDGCKKFSKGPYCPYCK